MTHCTNCGTYLIREEGRRFCSSRCKREFASSSPLRRIGLIIVGIVEAAGRGVKWIFSRTDKGGKEAPE